MTPGEWIEWAGGECPVPSNVLVDIAFGPGATGKQYSPIMRTDPMNWEWQHGKAPLDINAYRLVQS